MNATPQDLHHIQNSLPAGGFQAATAGREPALVRLRRERGFSLEEVAAAMEVRVAYLEALERGELDRVLGPGYVRSIFTRYAVCLGVDPEPLLAALPPGSGCSRVAGHSPAGGAARGATGRAGLVRYGLLGLAAVGLVAAAFLGALHLDLIASSGAARATAETTDATLSRADLSAAGPSDASPPDPKAELAKLPAGPDRPWTSGSGAAAAAPAASPSFRVLFTPTDAVWLEVTGERSGRVLFAGTRPKGEILELQVGGPLIIRVGRPEAVEVLLNGAPLAVPNAFRWRISAAGIEVRE